MLGDAYNSFEHREMLAKQKFLMAAGSQQNFKSDQYSIGQQQPHIVYDDHQVPWMANIASNQQINNSAYTL